MQDRKTRATAALSLLKNAMQADDQDGTDFLASVIENEGLYREYVNDRNGEPFDTMTDFVAELETESDLELSGITASAGRPRRLTLEERHHARMVSLGRA